MDVDLVRSGTARSSHNTVLWFEFLLNPSLLEHHLQEETPDPSPTDLIVMFLAISPCSNTKEAESKQNENESPENTKNEVSGSERSYKYLALKILALKVTAFLKWNLAILEKRLPLPMQLTLLLDLLYLTLEQDVDVETHLELDLNSCPGHILFAITLYHRWILRAVVYSRLALKQTRQPYIPVPGLQAPTYVPADVSEDFVRGLDSQVTNSIAVLTRVIGGTAVPTVPVFDTFMILTEDSTDVRQNWDKCVQISSVEFLCQLHFDLASFHFFREEYSEAGELFRKATELRQQLDSEVSVYCTVSLQDLKGYSDACDITSPTVSSHSLTYQLHRAIRDQYTGIVSILQADNLHREIPQVYRDTLELDIEGAVSSHKFTVARDLLLQVRTLNVVRRVVTGTLTGGDYIHRLHQGGSKTVDFLFSALKHILPHCNLAEKRHTKLFVMQLVEGGDIEGLPEQLPSFLTDLFTPGEIEEMSNKTLSIRQDVVDIPELLLKTDWDMTNFTVSNSVRLETGSLEQQLLLSYDAAEIRGLVEKLVAANPAKPQWRINNKWELPIPLQSMAMSLPRGFVQDFAYILLAKSRELTTMKDFKQATDLLDAVEKEACNNAINSGVMYKLSRLLSWEKLLIQITEFLIEWPNHKLSTSSLVSDCMQCLSALQSGDSVIPRLEVMEHCAVCLLNLGEWEYLIGLEKRWIYIELTAAIAYACLDIAKYKGNKKVSREAWDIVLPIFGPSVQKRSASGLTTVIHRDSPNNSSTLTRTTLAHFLARLRDSTALAVVISLLARLYNVIRDEPILELIVDYTGLWPAVVSNANSYNLRPVCEILLQLLLQALQFHPTNVAWLKVMGDLNFALVHYAVALRYYLEAAIVVSDFFSQPIPRAAIDDHVYKRMIKCCTYLHCHTEAAVLCQFLEEVDYTTAFKSLSDIKSSTCSDAMDSFYSCIWDITILEYLVYLHTKRGEHHRKDQAIKVIGLLELNANNNEEIQREAANIRKSRFLRAMARQYVC